MHSQGNENQIQKQNPWCKQPNSNMYACFDQNYNSAREYDAYVGK